MSATVRKRQVRVITCACCGRRGYHNARGWIESCYTRWLTAGRPPDGPPPLSVRRKPQPDGSVLGRIEDYYELTRERGFTLQRAAWRLDISRRTAERYEARLRDQAQQGAA